MKSVPEDGDARHACFVERRVHRGEERVTETDRVADVALDGLLEEVRLATLGVDVSVRAEEGREGADLVPAHHHLWGGVPEESANVGWTESVDVQRDGAAHLQRRSSPRSRS